MSSVLHNRLVRHSVLGRYPLFLGLGGGLTILGLILFIGALASGEGDRAWHLFHVNWLYFTGLSAGSIAFVAVLKITNAKWAGMITRFAGASSAFMAVSFVALLLIFTAGYKSIYGPMNAAFGELQHSKVVWLSHDFMFARLAIGLLVMIYAGWRLIRADLVPDMFDARDAVTGARRALFDRWSREYDGSAKAAQEQYGRIRHYAPIYAVIYSIVMTLVAFDGIMALQPHWFSNLFGAFYFMGSYLGAHMLLALVMMYGSSHLGVNDLVSGKQRHDLGKLCFGFTVFWTYLMWAQFLVIWYGNMPEETGFVFSRLWGRWLPIGSTVLIGMFVIPFFGLLGVAPKKVKPVFGFFATVSLVALWLERYLLVMPSITALPGPVIGSPEIGPTLLFAGLYLLSYALFARTFPMIAPRLAEITLSRERSHAFVEAEYEHETGPEDYVALELVERRERPR